jgi:hypothetical protein
MPLIIISHLRLTRKSEVMKIKRAAESVYANSIGFLGWPGLHPQTLVNELGNFYFVTSPKDDIVVTKEGRKRGLLLDGRTIKRGKLMVSGVGGINPHDDMERLRKLIPGHEGSAKHLILSYFPPYGCGDQIALLGKKRGLVELLQFLAEVRPDYVISTGEKNQVCNVHGVNVMTLNDSTNAAIVNLNEHFRIKCLKLP